MRLGACSDAQAPSAVPATAPAEESVEPTPPVSVPAAAVAPTAAGPGAPTKASSVGIWALALAALGLIGLLPIIGSVLGLILGWVGVRRSATRRVLGGRGLALTAAVISVITLVAVVAITVVYALLIAYGTI